MSLHLALFGDSIAAGVGAARSLDTPAELLAADLRTTGVDAQARCFAVSGARSAALAGQVAAAGEWPQLAVVVIGANDLTHLLPVGQAVVDLTRGLSTLRGRGVEVVLVPVPDLSVVTHVPPGLREFARAASAGLRVAQTEAAHRLGVRTVDTSVASAAFDGDRSLFASDAFHPSSAGYRVLAAAVAPVLRVAAAALTGRTQDGGGADRGGT